MRILGGVLICWAFLAILLLNSGCSAAPQLTPQQRVKYGLLGVRVACGECTDATCGRDVVELCRQLFPVEVRVPPEPGLDTMPRSGDSGPPQYEPGPGNGVRSIGGAPGQ